MVNISARSLTYLVAALSFFVTAMPARSQPNGAEIAVSKKGESIRLFEDITISPNFTPQVVELRGISGGNNETQSKSGRKVTETGECIGFVDAIADHKITLTKPFRYLKLQVKSSGDTIMLIKGPGGSWCNDDSSDRNPIIAGDWLAGTYEIWIGSYEANSSFPYLLQITESSKNN
ncbi:MAG: hypothetical protein NW214_13245 [Pseudanabaenaceae cyanobacterium bins.39]|nr:hypothetical protein [Pseudanabaenaceae cyanobacterium bins.39]